MSDTSKTPLTASALHDVIALVDKAVMANIKTLWHWRFDEYGLTLRLDLEAFLPGISIGGDQYDKIEDSLNKFLSSTLPNSLYPVKAKARVFDFPLQGTTAVIVVVTEEQD